jgi:hypothetical protein
MFFFLFYFKKKISKRPASASSSLMRSQRVAPADEALKYSDPSLSSIRANRQSHLVVDVGLNRAKKKIILKLNIKDRVELIFYFVVVVVVVAKV